MYGYALIGNVLVADPRKSAGKQALCVMVPKDFPIQQSRGSYPVGFYVKGSIDRYHFKMVKLIKLDDGSFLFHVPTEASRKMKKKAGDGVNLSITKDRVYHGMHHDLLMALYYKEPEEENKDLSSFYYRLREMGRHEFNE